MFVKDGKADPAILRMLPRVAGSTAPLRDQLQALAEVADHLGLVEAGGALRDLPAAKRRHAWERVVGGGRMVCTKCGTIQLRVLDRTRHETCYQRAGRYWNRAPDCDATWPEGWEPLRAMPEEVGS